MVLGYPQYTQSICVVLSKKCILISSDLEGLRKAWVTYITFIWFLLGMESLMFINARAHDEISIQFVRTLSWINYLMLSKVWIVTKTSYRVHCICKVSLHYVVICISKVSLHYVVICKVWISIGDIATFITVVKFVCSMDYKMGNKAWTLSKCFATFTEFVRLLCSMNSMVIG